MPSCSLWRHCNSGAETGMFHLNLVNTTAANDLAPYVARSSTAISAFLSWLRGNHNYLQCFSVKEWYRMPIHIYRADSRFAPSQWEPALICNDISHWLGTNLESAMIYKVFLIFHTLLNFLYCRFSCHYYLWMRATYHKDEGYELIYVFRINWDSWHPGGSLRKTSTVKMSHHMMMSSNANIFHATGPLWEESTSHR